MPDAEIFIEFKDNTAEFANRFITNVTLPLKMMEQFDKTVDDVNNTMGDYNSWLKISTNRNKNLSVSMGKTTQAGRMNTMSILSVMFAAQALASTFGGLADTIFKSVGIYDMFSGVLMTIFAPILPDIIKFATTLTTFFTNIPEPIKKFIAGFILFAAIFGTILAVVSSVVLVILAVGAAVILFGAGLVAAFLIIPAIIALIATIIISNWEAISNFVTGVWNAIVEGFWAFVKWVSDGFWSLVEIVSNIVRDISQFFADLWDKIVDAFWQFIDWVSDGFWGFVEFVGSIPDKIMDFFSGVGQWLIDVFVGAIDGIKDLFIGLVDWLKTIPIIGDIVRGAEAVVGAIAGGLGQLFGFQFGGVVPKTGLYMLHEGETVNSAQTTGFGGGGGGDMYVTINANVSSDYDVETLARQLEEVWGGKFV